MEIKEISGTVVKDLQDGFHQVYPHLWIDFFYPDHTQRGIIREEKLGPLIRVNNLLNGNTTLAIDISGNQTISVFEKKVLEVLGLKVEVLRKSSNVWVPTRYTSNWTLDSQDFEGKQIVI